nr:hypothetical protein CFP56_75949 [Quercus suber]
MLKTLNKIWIGGIGSDGLISGNELGYHLSQTDGMVKSKARNSRSPQVKKSSNIRETKSLKRSSPEPSTKSSKSTPSTSTSSSSSSLHRPLQQKATNPPLLRNHENRESGIGSLSVGNNTKSLVEIPHRHAIDLGSGSGGVEQAQAAISAASLGRVGVADTREKSDRFQGFSNSAPREFSHVETIPSAQNGNELRSPSLLQRGCEGDTELSNNVETRLGSFQRPSSENGMEHDSNINDGN